MREVCRSALCSYVAFYVSKQGMPPIYAQGYHIQATYPVVLPLCAAVLGVVDIVWLYSSAQKFFFGGRHYSLPDGHSGDLVLGIQQGRYLVCLGAGLVGV